MDKKIEIKLCEVDNSFAKGMKSWLETKAKDRDLESSEMYLLSFHDDGVVWGKIEKDVLITSYFTGSPSPEFRSETLQELRLFGEKGQLHIWRIGENEFKASLALDSDEGEYDFLQDEEQVLHGTKTENDSDANREFTIVADGSEGLRHAFPKVVSDDSFKQKDERGNVVKDKNGKEVRKRPLRLHVKHYIEYDIDGCARIAFSRLVNVSVEGV